MKISGITIVRNGVKLGYPFVESIKSVLPLCSEFIVGVGDSDDDTRKKIEEIADTKIKIIDSVWDLSFRTGGTILSEKTNEILEKCEGDWIFYIQADEVALEADYKKIESAVALAEQIPDVEGIYFDYKHFYGSYYMVQSGRNWYGQEVRIVRNRRGICSYGDAQGFRIKDKKIKAIPSDANIFHYGWARPPEVMMEKIKSFHKLWHNDDWINENCSSTKVKDYFSDLGNLVEFRGDHPEVMKGAVNRNSEPFIKQCFAEYMKHRSFSESIRDFLRKLPFGKNKNFKPVRKF